MRGSHRVAPLAVLALLIPATPIAAAPDLSAVSSPVRLVAKGGTTVAVAGLHDYLGTIELSAHGSGIAVSNTLSLERYLLGLAEVPPTWPEEALKAQAVAARTYALDTLARPPAGEAATYGFDICATIQCQVFSGAEVLGQIGGGRWKDAVEATAGQAVLYGGEPILARYHSVSGGRTIDNEDAFPGEPAYPYLVSVESPWEEGSSLFRWETSFTLADLQAMLVRAGWWDVGQLGPLQDVHTTGGDERFYNPPVVFRGRDGSIRRTSDELRTIVRTLAPAMFPGLYPGAGGSGRLPETLPSERLSISTSGERVSVLGRGWGHGSGMSQWGAHGLASLGRSYVDILTHYYTGTTVAPVPAPGKIEVGVATAERQVTVSGDFSIVDGSGRTLVENALGTWRFSWAGSGAISVDPPEGFGLPLRVSIVDAPKRVEAGGNGFITVTLSRPAHVATKTPGSPTAFQDPGERVTQAGRRRLPWFAPLEPGTYRVEVIARTGGERRTTKPVKIEVFERRLQDDEPVPEASPTFETAHDEEPGSGGGAAAAVVSAVFLVLILLGAAALRTSGRGRGASVESGDGDGDDRAAGGAGARPDQTGDPDGRR